MSGQPTLGHLEDRPLRAAWSHEAHVFSVWLSENLEILEGAIGMPLEFVSREVSVDEFSADLLLRSPATGVRVLVENQLEKADHRHLGQILTYLAGLDVQIVVWIAADFRAAHRSAIGWLNKHTSSDFSFFMIRVRVVQIGDSALAPVLEVVEQPNGWERTLASIASGQDRSGETGAQRIAFWKAYLERFPQDRALGVAPSGTNIWLEATPELVISAWPGVRNVGLFLRGPRGAPHEEIGESVQQAFGSFENLEEKLSTRVGLQGRGHLYGQEFPIDLEDQDTWPEAIDWLHNQIVLYVTTLREGGSQDDE
ncbi:MAG: hypothetical protein AAFR84_07365 [Pseudomonadota bacterium]